MSKFYPSELKAIRKKKGISIEKMAELFGVTRVTLWRWETNKKVPAELQIRQLAKILNISVSEISDLKDEVEHSPSQYTDIIDSWKILANTTEQEQIFQEEKLVRQIRDRHYELRQASIVIRAILSSLETIFYFKDSNNKYIIANSAFLENLSLKPKYSVLGKQDEDFFIQAESKENTEQDLYVLGRGKPIRNVEQLIPGSKKRKLGLISKLPVFDSQGKIAGVIGSFVDITERVRSEHQRQLLEKVINHADDIFWIARYDNKRNDFKYLFLNNAIKKIYGIDDKNVKNFTPFEKDIGKTIGKKLESLKAKTFPFEETSSITRTDNEKRILNRRIFRLPEENIYYGVTKDITDEIISNETRQILEEAIEDMNDGFSIRNLNTNNYIFLNAVHDKIFGYPREDFYKGGVDLWLNKMLHKDDRLIIKKYRDSRSWPEKIEYRIVKPNGEIRYIESSNKVKYYHNQLCLTSVVRDITDRKHSEEIQKLLNIHLASTSTALVIRTEDKVLYANKGLADLYGYPLEKLVEGYFDFRINTCVHPDYREAERNKKTYSENKKWPVIREQKIIRPDGENRWLRATVHPVTYFGEDVYAVVITDVTDEKRISELFELFEKHMETTGAGIILSDHTKVLYISPVVADIYGYPVEEINSDRRIEYWLDNLVHPDDRKEQEEYMTGKKPFPPRRKFRIIRSDGQIRWLQVDSSFMEYMGKKCYLGISKDITEDVKTEEKRLLLEKSIDSMSEAVIILDIETLQYLYLNKAVENIYGYPLDNFYKNGSEFWLETCVHPDDIIKQKKSIGTLKWEPNRSYRIVRPDGEIRWLKSMNANEIVYNSTKCMLLIESDITDQVNLQKTVEKYNT